MKMRDTVNQVVELSSGWERGENLSVLVLSDGLRQQVFRQVREAFGNRFEFCSDDEKRAWGALMMLAGALVFHEFSEGPFTYERVWERIGFRERQRALTIVEYAAMEKGAKRHWGIEVIRRRDKRLFQGTMLMHSGASLSILAGVCDQVGKGNRWSWGQFASAAVEDIDAWIQSVAEQGASFSVRNQRVLENAESREAIAERLKELGTQRNRLKELGLLRGDFESTRKAVEESGDITLHAFFQLPAAAASDEILKKLLDFVDKDERVREGFAWHCDVRSGYPRLLLRVPEKLWLGDVPTNVDVVLLDIAGANSRSAPRYRRREGAFVLESRVALLEPGQGGAFPVLVVASYRDGKGGEAEVEVCQVSFLEDEPVQVFDAGSGDEVKSLSVGQDVYLVADRSAEFRGKAEFEGARKSACGRFVVVRSEVPSEPVELEIRHGDGVFEPWVFGSGSRRIVFNPFDSSDVISALRVGHTRVLRRWPEPFELQMAGGEVDWKVEHEGVVRTGRGVVRAGRLIIPEPAHEEEFLSGLFRVRVKAAGKQGMVRFVVLPADVAFVAGKGLEGMKLSVRRMGAVITHERKNLVGHDGELLLGADDRGRQSVMVRLEDGRLPVMRWTVENWNERARKMLSPGGEAIDARGDIRKLRGSGGVFLEGKPGQICSLRERYNSFAITRYLDTRGERFIPFSNVPGYLLNSRKNQELQFDIFWEGRNQKRSFGPYRDPAEQVPVVTYDRGDRVVYVKKLASRAHFDWEGVVRCMLVSDDRPWEGAVVVETTIDREGGYSGVVGVVPGTYKVTLTDVGGERLCGYQRILIRSSEVGEERELPGETRQIIDVFRSEGGAEYRDAALANVIQWGVKWFVGVSTALGSLLSWERLYTWAEEEVVANADDVERLFQLLDWPLFTLRFDAFENLGILGDEKEVSERICELIEELAGQDVGLLVPAFLNWNGYLKGEDWERVVTHPQVSRWFSIMRGTDWPVLEEGEPESLTVETEVYDDSEESLRLGALRGARSFQGELTDDLALREFVDKLSVEARAESAERFDYDFFRQKGVGERLQQIECVVAYLCFRIHEWRTGKVDELPYYENRSEWEQVRKLADRLPAMFDFWLNLFAATRGHTYETVETECVNEEAVSV